MTKFRLILGESWRSLTSNFSTTLAATLTIVIAMFLLGLSIARAVVNHPPLLVCDEPTGNLDPDTSVGIMQLLYRINRSGTTILMVTHDREMVDKMRRRVIGLEDGRLARDERRGGYESESGPALWLPRLGVRSRRTRRRRSPRR